MPCRSARSDSSHSSNDFERLGVIDREELLGLLRLHGDILRAIEEPLDDGERFDEETFSSSKLLLGDGEA